MSSPQNLGYTLKAEPERVELPRAFTSLSFELSAVASRLATPYANFVFFPIDIDPMSEIRRNFVE